MECRVCSYEYEEELIEGEIKATVGDEDFIVIQSKHGFCIDNPKEVEYGDYDYKSKIDVTLMACPKCKTVFFEI